MNRNRGLCLSADMNNLQVAREWLEKSALRLGVDPARIPNLILATEEAFSNIVHHGYAGADEGEVELEAEREGNAVVVRIRDHASTFNPLDRPEPDIHTSLEERPVGGMGIYLIKNSVDKVKYRTLPDGGNELELLLKAEPEGS